MPTLIKIIGNVLAPIVAQMGMMLLSERVVRRVAVLTLRSLEAKTSNATLKAAIDTIADAWDVPAPTQASK